MAVVTAVAVGSLIGLNLNATVAGTSTDWEGAPFAAGTTVLGTDGGRYTFCQAGAAISTTTSEPYTLAIDENFQAVKITKVLASAGHLIGVAPQVVIADNAFFWARMSGSNINMKVAVSCAADTNLWTTATAGILDDTSGATHVAVLGIKLVVSASASQSAGSTIREVIMGNTLVPLLIA